MNVLKSENILQNVELKGKLFEKLLAHSSIVEIRRKGLFFAIEMKNKDIVRRVYVEGCRDMGVLSFWFLSSPESL